MEYGSARQKVLFLHHSSLAPIQVLGYVLVFRRSSTLFSLPPIRWQQRPFLPEFHVDTRSHSFSTSHTQVKAKDASLPYPILIFPLPPNAAPVTHAIIVLN